MRSLLCINCLILVAGQSIAEEPLPGTTAKQTQAVTESVDEALAWLAKQQRADGSFPGPSAGQPGITSLVVLSFLSAGHVPGGQYDAQLTKAIEYALRCKLADGCYSAGKPRPTWVLDEPSHTATYNHAVTALMFAELSGQLEGPLGEKVSAAVERCLDYTKRTQFLSVPGRPQDEGGWRYARPHPTDRFKTDLSITAWQVTFLRSAKNAGYDVDDRMIAAALKYVKGMFKPEKRTFTYDHYRESRGMAGAGIMAMAMLGQHDTDEVRSAATWLRSKPFMHYGQSVGQLDRFQYSVYYCTQAMYQVGGKQWERFYAELMQLLLRHQLTNGSWPAVGYERPFGDVYATSMTVLSLTAPYAMLPIHQR